MEGKAPSQKEGLIREVVGFNFRKFWPTFKALTVRPGQTITAYCDGHRSETISPVAYFLLAFGISFFIIEFPGVFPVPKQTGSPDLFTDLFRWMYPAISDSEMRALYRSAREISHSKEFRLIERLPVLILFQWLFFRTYRKQFIYSVYFSLFILAQIDFITIPIYLPLFFDPSFIHVTVNIAPMVGAGIYLYAAFGFYPGITMGSLILRSSGMYITGLIFTFVSSIIMLVITAVIMKMFS